MADADKDGHYPTDDELTDYVVGDISPERASEIEALASQDDELAAEIFIIKGLLADTCGDDEPST